MHNSKLVEILKSFSTSEIYRLGLFLQSPYFQERDTGEKEWCLYQRLLDYLVNNFDGELKKEVVYQHIFPDTVFVKGKLEKKMSALFKQVQQFIIHEQSNQNQTEFKELMALSGFYQAKKLSRLYKITFAALEKHQATTIQRDRDFYYNHFLLQLEVVQNKSIQNTRGDDIHLPETLKSLDVFYLATKLELAYGLLSLKEFQIPIDAQGSLQVLQSITPFIKEGSYLDVPIIKIYHKAILVLQNTEDEQTFAELRDLLEKYQTTLPVVDQKALKALCRNFCVHQFNKGHHSYLEQAYHLYKEDLEQGALYYNDGIVPGVIRNIVSIGLKLKKHDWVYRFLEDHKDRIIGVDHPAEVYRFNLAHYYFELKDYENTLQYLSDHYNDLYYRIAAKRLEIKVYFEQQSVLLQPKMDAFKIIIHRWAQKKIAPTHQQANNNFINALRQIITPGTRFNEKRIRRVIQKIKEQEVTTEKEWLLEKLEEQISNNLKTRQKKN